MRPEYKLGAFFFIFPFLSHSMHEPRGRNHGPQGAHPKFHQPLRVSLFEADHGNYITFLGRRWGGIEKEYRQRHSKRGGSTHIQRRSCTFESLRLGLSNAVMQAVRSDFFSQTAPGECGLNVWRGLERGGGKTCRRFAGGRFRKFSRFETGSISEGQPPHLAASAGFDTCTML